MITRLRQPQYQFLSAKKCKVGGKILSICQASENTLATNEKTSSLYSKPWATRYTSPQTVNLFYPSVWHAAENMQLKNCLCFSQEKITLVVTYSPTFFVTPHLSLSPLGNRLSLWLLWPTGRYRVKLCCKRSWHMLFSPWTAPSQKVAIM